jgi:hypothetical protein
VADCMKTVFPFLDNSVPRGRRPRIDA